MRLDEEKLEALRSWGARLRQTGGEESVAVGRAILMLVEEIDRLHIDLWNARLQRHDDQTVTSDPAGGDTEEQVGRTLNMRLRRALWRGSSGGLADVENPASAEADAASQAWIDSLRRKE